MNAHPLPRCFLAYHNHAIPYMDLPANENTIFGSFKFSANDLPHRIHEWYKPAFVEHHYTSEHMRMLTDHGHLYQRHFGKWTLSSRDSSAVLCGRPVAYHMHDLCFPVKIVLQRCRLAWIGGLK